MGVCRIDPATQMDILRLLAAILHLGNVAFDEENNQALVKGVAGPSLEWAASLLSVSKEMLQEKVGLGDIRPVVFASKTKNELYSTPLTAHVKILGNLCWIWTTRSLFGAAQRRTGSRNARRPRQSSLF